MDYNNQSTEILKELRDSIKHVHECLGTSCEHDEELICIETILAIRDQRERRRQQVKQLRQQFGPKNGSFRDV